MYRNSLELTVTSPRKICAVIRLEPSETPPDESVISTLCCAAVRVTDVCSTPSIFTISSSPASTSEVAPSFGNSITMVGVKTLLTPSSAPVSEVDFSVSVGPTFKVSPMLLVTGTFTPVAEDSPAAKSAVS